MRILVANSMESLRGLPEEVFTEGLTRLDNPLLVTPTVPWARGAVHASRHSEQTVRLLVAEGVPDRFSWATKAWIADLLATDELAIRTAPATDVLLAGTDSLGIVDRAPKPPRAYLSEYTDSEVLDRWDEAESVEIDATRRSEFLATADELLGADGRATVEDAVDTAARGTDVNPVAALVWAGAVSRCPLVDVVDAVTDAGLSAKKTVYRYRDSLREAGVIETEPRTSDGAAGPPSQRLVPTVDVRDDTLPPAIRDVL
jgi:hypothetical protein